ncbi:hypothetical protein H4R35_000439 [Dimargaris xerosporica]|nr:hypothetical protein H4R35_000439 [Dimargaris xerosporica]
MATRVYRPGLLADHSSSPTYAPSSPFHRDTSAAHSQYTVNTASYPASETRSTISRSSTDGPLSTASVEEALHDSAKGSPTNSTCTPVSDAPASTSNAGKDAVQEEEGEPKLSGPSSQITRAFNERDVVFVDPLDPGALYWWPAMIVPRAEIDNTMGCGDLGDHEYLVNSVVQQKDLFIFDPHQEPFLKFSRVAGAEFGRDRGVRNALTYLRTGQVSRRFAWPLWNQRRGGVLVKHLEDGDLSIPDNVPFSSVFTADRTASALVLNACASSPAEFHLSTPNASKRKRFFAGTDDALSDGRATNALVSPPSVPSNAKFPLVPPCTLRNGHRDPLSSPAVLSAPPPLNQEIEAVESLLRQKQARYRELCRLEKQITRSLRKRMPVQTRSTKATPTTRAHKRRRR